MLGRGEVSLRRRVFEQGPGRGEAGSHLDILRESIPSSRASQCKGPEAGGHGVFSYSKGAPALQLELSKQEVGEERTFSRSHSE